MSNVRAFNHHDHAPDVRPVETVPVSTLPLPLTSFIGREPELRDILALLDNDGTRLLTLVVSRDGEEIDRHPLTGNVALETGQTELSDRYIPADDWQPGTYTFQVVVSAIDRANAGTTVLATFDVENEIEVP